MFTGIITDLGRVERVEKRGDTRIVFRTGYETTGIATGASIACNGCCLTLVEKGPGWFSVDASAETLSKTTLGAWEAGTPVNFERSLCIGDELGGHLVYGHVDGVAQVTGIEPDGDSLRFEISAPKDLMCFVASKGSVAIDGVSLTVNEVGDASFGINIIPHTAQATTFGTYTPGARVNMEIDMLARYVARLLPKGLEN